MAEVLVVDDDEAVRRMMAAILKNAGHKTTMAASGLEALKLLGVEPKDASVRLPDVLVLDIMMPKIDGYAVATLLRNNPRTRAIPILVVSALHEMSRLFKATVRLDGFLTKPFRPEALISDVAKILEMHQTSA
jgi:CheY-like chemotaxis protein